MVTLKKFNKKCTCSASNPPYSILVDSGELRLYLYQGGKLLKDYPVSLGKQDTPTPKGIFRIINKDNTPDPAYGTAWMGLNHPHIGIHGTSRPKSMGHASSEGCIRMFNPDIEELFYKLPLGTKVTIK